MPYSGISDPKLPANVKALPASKRSQWVAAWTSAYDKCKEDGGSDCEATAFKVANGAVKEATAAERYVSMEFAIPADGVPEWIPLLPRPGVYQHTLWGEVNLTPERNAHFADNINNKVYQQHIPIDAEHQLELSGALGWMQEARINADGSVDVRVEWSDRGREMIIGDRFRYVSPAYLEKWSDPATNVQHTDVIIGAALCVRPFFKDDSLRSIVASEKKLWGWERLVGDVAHRMEFTERSAEVALKDMTAVDIQALAPAKLRELLKAAKFSELSEEQAVAVADAMLAEQEVDTSELDAAIAERDALKAELAGLQTDAEADDSSELPAEFTELRTAHEATVKTLAEARAEIKQLRDDARAKRFTDMAAPWPGKAAEHVAAMAEIAERIGEESSAFKQYVATQEAAAAVVVELSRVTGRSNAEPDANDVNVKMDQLTRKHMESNPGMTYAKAYSEMLEQNQELYGEIVGAA